VRDRPCPGGGEILLIRRSDNGNWALPAEAVDLGESLAPGGSAGTPGDSGIQCEITGRSGLYTDPQHVILSTSNGEIRQEFSIVLTARATGGQPTPSDETSEAPWVPLNNLDGDPTDPSMRLQVQHYAGHLSHPLHRIHSPGRGR
jgi:hypothetical protein